MFPEGAAYLHVKAIMHFFFFFNDKNFFIVFVTWLKFTLFSNQYSSHMMK